MRKLCDYFSEVGTQTGEEYEPSVSSISHPFYLALADGFTELEVNREEFVMLMMFFKPGSDNWKGKIYGIKLIVVQR